ncbi:hypothetical protein BGX27_003235, partial [Mortierella sp. AM989]
MSARTADPLDATIPDEALNEVNRDESDDGLPILETSHDSASDNEADDYDSASDSEADDHDDEVGDYSSDVSDSEPETEGDIVHPDALDPPHESMETTPTYPVEHEAEHTDTTIFRGLIFYVDKQDFDAWLEQDGRDLFLSGTSA